MYDGHVRARANRDALKAWLIDTAYPLWWAAGADRRCGGFHEALTLNATPLKTPRRARVQPRQIYAFAAAGSLGWDGPWTAAVEHGLAYLDARYRKPDGLYRTLVAADGRVLDDDAVLYDQAFVLLGLAAAYRALPERLDFVASADALRARLYDRMSGAGVGFTERAGAAGPLLSNPHMHLLEASLAWLEATGEPAWRAAADEIASLALEVFIDGESGALREVFSPDGTPAPGIAGHIVEPGHQFEWAWLLLRWAEIGGRADAKSAALRLIRIGDGAGSDPGRGVTVNALLDDFSVHDAAARLWPQTERIKAGVAAVRSTGDSSWWDTANAGAEGLRTFLETPRAGLWRDRMDQNGEFAEEPVPASSFYHIVCAISELDRAVDGAT
jgi:mannose/cellobiose epimerase-like protein (N-acyl-D-glucosamine 2-epimerase family)